MYDRPERIYDQCRHPPQRLVFTWRRIDRPAALGFLRSRHAGILKRPHQPLDKVRPGLGVDVSDKVRQATRDFDRLNVEPIAFLGHIKGSQAQQPAVHG
jgi:hypothetical protein